MATIVINECNIFFEIFKFAYDFLGDGGNLNMDVTEEGILISSMDGSHVCLMKFVAKKCLFKKYEITKNMPFGLSVSSMFGILKKFDKKRPMCIVSEESKPDEITVSGKNKFGDKIDYSLKLLDIDSESLSVPEEHYTTCSLIKLPYKRFKDVFANQMNVPGIEVLELELSKKGLIVTCDDSTSMVKASVVINNQKIIEEKIKKKYEKILKKKYEKIKTQLKSTEKETKKRKLSEILDDDDDDNKSTKKRKLNNKFKISENEKSALKKKLYTKYGYDENIKIILENDDIISTRVSSKLMQTSCKVTNISKNVNLYIPNEMPLLIEFIIPTSNENDTEENYGYLRIWVAPKIEET